ncbi:MAG: amidohydrolase family protein, partial [Aureibaculum sp.]|nr:amidohydrolase family protein [Aureibaculum sp.]
MKKLISLLLIILSFAACTQQQKADLIVVNANIYTVNDEFSKAEAFAIKDGIFIAIGTNDEINQNFATLKTIDAEGKTILPGLIDAHCHFYGLGLQQQRVDLTGTKSYDEVLQRIVDFQKEKNVSYITGRGWDQNDWEVKEFPTKEKLDAL